jgi:hypothetical protein
MTRTTKLVLPLVPACLVLTLMSPARAVTITSHAADFEPRLQTSTGSFAPGPSTTADRLRVGFQANFQINGAYFFRLPVFAPGSQPILAADFSVAALPDTAATAATPTHNADLVALGFTNTDPPANGAAESQAYFFLGEGATDVAAGRQLIQNNFLAPSDFIPLGGTATVESTDAAGDLALAAYINNLYLTQAPNGFVPGTSYLILRLNPDQLTGAGTNRYSLASADNVSGAQLPTLNLTVIPEPATASLVAGLLALLACTRLLQRRS